MMIYVIETKLNDTVGYVLFICIRLPYTSDDFQLNHTIVFLLLKYARVRSIEF